MLSFVDCPFEPGFCLNGTQAAVLDSGYLDSNDILGINARSRDRVLIRRKTTCAPLEVGNRTKIFQSNDSVITSALGGGTYSPEQQAVNTWTAVLLGTSEGWSDNITTLHSSLASNVSVTYTYEYVAQDLQCYRRVSFVPVTNMLSSAAVSYQHTGSKPSGFVPLEDLAQKQGDLTMVSFYTNSVVSFEPIDDPMYSAHREFVQPGMDPTYLGDRAINTLGCIEQVCVVPST